MDVAIQTDAPNVRVRVISPFVSNVFYASGVWDDTTGVHWTSSFNEIVPTAQGVCNYSFTARTPSMYILVIQAENAAYARAVAAGNTPPDEWRWLGERWLFVQVVNQYVRTPNAQILVVDATRPNGTISTMPGGSTRAGCCPLSRNDSRSPTTNHK